MMEWKRGKKDLFRPDATPGLANPEARADAAASLSGTPELVWWRDEP